MPYRLNLASILIRLRDIGGHQVIASTDGHRARVLIRDVDNPATDWRYADLVPEVADALPAAITTRHHPRPMRWFARRARRRAAKR